MFPLPLHLPNFYRNNLALAFAVLLLTSKSLCFSQGFEAKRLPDRVDLSQDGQLITSYHFKSGTKPILWPLIGPKGARMSREFPMVQDSKNEAHDHPHHRSLWMTFGEVNDVDFWAEGQGKGEVIHSEVIATGQTSTSAFVQAKHIWKTVDTAQSQSHALLEENCKYSVSGTANERIIDCEYILKHADQAEKKPIHFGDTKEGMFAIRVPESMRADNAGGHILNSNGKQDGDAWGQPADWVDYSGKATPDAKEEVGIAILIHPTSFGRTGYWHVRTYGLFAHNPIGVKHFIEGRSEQPEKTTGGFTLNPGESMHLLYRVVFHPNRWDIGQGNERFLQFKQKSADLK